MNVLYTVQVIKFLQLYKSIENYYCMNRYEHVHIHLDKTTDRHTEPYRLGGICMLVIYSMTVVGVEVDFKSN